MTPNELFLRFGLPCLKHMMLPDQAKDEIRQRFFRRVYLSRSEIEEIYSVAPNHMKRIFGGDYFTERNIIRFFLMFHNRLAKAHATDDARGYWCLVRVGQVVKLMQPKVSLYYSDYDPMFDKTRLFDNDYGLELAVNDMVVVHDRCVVGRYDDLVRL